MSSRVLAATLLSLATAFFYALSNVLEMLEAEKVPDEYALRAGLLVRLVKRPRWLLGLLSDVGGFLTQAAALGLAAVVFVEPILATGILMSLFLGAAFTHRPVHRSDWIAALRAVGRARALPVRGVADRRYATSATCDRWLIAGPIAVARDRAVHALRPRDARTGPRRVPRRRGRHVRSASRRCSPRR